MPVQDFALFTIGNLIISHTAVTNSQQCSSPILKVTLRVARVFVILLVNSLPNGHRQQMTNMTGLRRIT